MGSSPNPPLPSHQQATPGFVPGVFYCLPTWGIEPIESIPLLGEVIPSWNGDSVFTGREPHNT